MLMAGQGENYYLRIDMERAVATLCPRMGVVGGKAAIGVKAILLFIPLADVAGLPRRCTYGRQGMDGVVLPPARATS